MKKPAKVDRIWQNASLTYLKQNGLKSAIVIKDSSEYGKATGQGVLDILDKIVYRLEKGKMKAYMCGLPQNFTIVEKEVDGFSLSVIQL